MKLNKTPILTVFTLILILSACSSIENTVSNKMDGVELELTIDKQKFTPGDEVIAKVSITNHSDSKIDVFIPTPKDTDKGIAAVMVETKRENQMLSQLLSPKNNEDIPNINGRTFYDFVLVQLEATEKIEQEFHWNKELLNQESRKNVVGGSGDYILSAFIILDELNNEIEYYEPEKQLISELNFTVE